MSRHDDISPSNLHDIGRVSAYTSAVLRRRATGCSQGSLRETLPAIFDDIRGLSPRNVLHLRRSQGIPGHLSRCLGAFARGLGGFGRSGVWGRRSWSRGEGTVEGRRCRLRWGFGDLKGGILGCLDCLALHYSVLRTPLADIVRQVSLMVKIQAVAEGCHE